MPNKSLKKVFCCLFSALFVMLFAYSSFTDEDKNLIIIPCNGFNRPKVNIDLYNYTNNRYETHEAILDTGCSVFLSMSAKLRAHLGLKACGFADVNLADGSSCTNVICKGEACFYGSYLSGEIFSALLSRNDGEILVGMPLIKSLGLAVFFDPIKEQILIGKGKIVSSENVEKIENLSKDGLKMLYGHSINYLENQLLEANISAITAFDIVSNQNDANFMDRAKLVSRQNWLVSKNDSSTFKDYGLTNEEAYRWYVQYMKANKAYKEAYYLKLTESDWQSLSIKNDVSKSLLKSFGYGKKDLESSLYLNVKSNLRNIISQFSVSEDYFEKQCDDAEMTILKAIDIITLQTLDNFYDRTLLGSRQQWLGGKAHKGLFKEEDVTNKEAYAFILDGYKRGDFPVLSDRLRKKK